MFDSVYVPCPRCGNRIEFQSKAGSCDGNEYTLTDAPALVKADIARYPEQCKNCGVTVGFDVQVIAIPLVYERQRNERGMG